MAAVLITIARDSLRAIERFRLRVERFERGVEAASQRAGTMLAHKIGEEEFGEGKTLRVVNASMRKSLAARTIRGSRSITVMVGITKGPATPYAAIHERGGVIRPKRGRYLAVPLRAAKTSGDRPRYPHGPRDPKIARHYPGGTFLLKRPGRDPIIMGMKLVAGGGKKRAKPTPLFVLKKSVTIPARHWLSGGTRRHFGVFEASLTKDIQELLES